MSSISTSPAGAPTRKDAVSSPLGTSDSWWTPPQAAPSPVADTSAGPPVAINSPSDWNPTISASGISLIESPVPIPMGVASVNTHPNMMATEETAASAVATASGSPDFAQLSSSHGPPKGPLIGGVITGVAVVATLVAAGLIYLYRGKQKRRSEEAAVERCRTACYRGRASSSASSTASDSISEFYVQQATAVQYQRCGPQAPGRHVQLSWSSGGGIGRGPGSDEGTLTRDRDVV